MDWQHIQPIIDNALKEDLSWGDITTDNLIDPTLTSELTLHLKQNGVIAGLPVAEQTFRKLDSELKWMTHHQDGDFLQKGTQLASIIGKTNAILKAERVALNFIQRLSGIATLTHQFVDKAKQGSSNVRIVDTRKTTPGLRILEKYAVKTGGGHNHRYNLSDAVLIKDNHLAVLSESGKTIQDIVSELREKIPHMMRIEIEVDTHEQLQKALDAKVDVILLDNMNSEELKIAVEMTNGQAILEASGGVNLDTIESIAKTGVDVISVGALTHSASSLDISLDFK